MANKPALGRRSRTVRTAAVKRKAKTKAKRAVPVRSGSLGQAAKKVVKSGARLVQHTAKRMITGAVRSTARVTSSALHSAVDRVQKIASK